MLTFLFILCILLLITSAISLIYLRLYKRQIRDIAAQSQFIQAHETNLQITSGVPDRDVAALIESVNGLLEQHRQIELKITQANLSFKRSITGISHDLRTPLTSASGYLQMLNDYELSDEKREAYLKIIDGRIQAVRQMLDQLFEFTRLEANELTLNKKPVNLSNSLRDMLSLFYNDFLSKNAEPQIDIPDTPFIVSADPDALKRVFSNIIGNALIHGEDPFSISVILSEKTGQVIFKNKTHSITTDDLPNIFERFYTTDTSRTRKTTGLGLSIAKTLVERMGGQIEARLDDQLFSICITFSYAP